jgi:hypothetical protein
MRLFLRRRPPVPTLSEPPSPTGEAGADSERAFVVARELGVRLDDVLYAGRRLGMGLRGPLCLVSPSQRAALERYFAANPAALSGVPTPPTFFTTGDSPEMAQPDAAGGQNENPFTLTPDPEAP